MNLKHMLRKAISIVSVTFWYCACPMEWPVQSLLVCVDGATVSQNIIDVTETMEVLKFFIHIYLQNKLFIEHLL